MSGGSDLAAVGIGLALGLFSYLGVETAAVAAGQVRDPDRNVPRASPLGTLACAAVYLVSLFVVFGVVPNSELQESNAPFSTAVNTMFGGSWAGYVMGLAVVVSGFGALNGWTMICAEMPLAAAKDGLFPERFGRLSEGRAHVRHCHLHGVGERFHGVQLSRQRGLHGVQHAGLHVRDHRRHPVRVLGVGPDQVAPPGRPAMQLLAWSAM